MNVSARDVFKKSKIIGIGSVEIFLEQFWFWFFRKILTILQEGRLLKYFSKVADGRDKRRQFYKLNISQKKRIVSWAHDMHKIFNF